MLGLTSRGWYVFYVFELLSEHPLKDAAFGQFWTVSLLPVLGLACSALVLGVRRVPLVLLAGGAALVVESYAALVHSGGRVNDLLPAYLAVALFAGLAMDGRPVAWRVSPRTGWLAAVSRTVPARTGGRGWPAGGPPPRPPRWSSRSWPC